MKRKRSKRVRLIKLVNYQIETRSKKETKIFESEFIIMITNKKYKQIVKQLKKHGESILPDIINNYLYYPNINLHSIIFKIKDKHIIYDSLKEEKCDGKTIKRYSFVTDFGTALGRSKIFDIYKTGHNCFNKYITRNSIKNEKYLLLNTSWNKPNKFWNKIFERKELKMKTAIFLIGGSGSGKTTLANQLISNYNFKKIKLETTRKPRNKLDLKNYIFISLDEYILKLNSDKYLYDIKINDTWRYGISKKEVNQLEKKDSIIDIINIEPIANIINYIKVNKLQIQPIIVFFNIPQKDRLQNLLDRGEDIESINIRFAREDTLNTFSKFNLKPNIVFNSYQEIELNKILNLIKG